MTNSTDAKQGSASKEIFQRLHDLDALPHFPDTLFKLERRIEDDVIEVDDAISLIAKDPRMVTGLIEMANSARYFQGSKINNLHDAVLRIGLNQVRLLAHAINYQATIKRKPPFSDKHFLKHAFMAANLAQNLAKRVQLSPGEAFLAGLMRDIGIYLLATEDRDKYVKVIELADYNIHKLPLAENQLFQTYHSLMSARLLQQWRFPNEIIMGVAFHHNPQKADKSFQAYAYLTFLAEYGVFRMGFENGVADITDAERETPSKALLQALAFFNLDLQEFDQILEQSQQQSEAMES